MSDFFAFVHANSQPTGRSENSSAPTSYFLQTFATAQMLQKTLQSMKMIEGILLLGSLTICNQSLAEELVWMDQY